MWYLGFHEMVGNMGILERDYDRPCCKLSLKRSGTRVASSRLSGGQFRDYDIITLMIFYNNQTLYTWLRQHQARYLPSYVIRGIHVVGNMDVLLCDHDRPCCSLSNDTIYWLLLYSVAEIRLSKHSVRRSSERSLKGYKIGTRANFKKNGSCCSR